MLSATRRLANGIVRPAVLPAALLLLASLPGSAAEAASLALQEETDSARYNISFTLRSEQPVRLAFARQKDGSGYLLELDKRRTALSRQDGSETVRLAAVSQGCLGAKPAAITVKRRPGELLVERDRRLLLRAYDDRYAAGATGFAEGQGADFRVQPVGDVECSDDFLPDSAVAKEWQAISGKWSIDKYRDPMMGEDQGPVGSSWYRAQGDGPCLAVGGLDSWDDLSIEVTAKLARGKSIGLVFNYRDPRNYGMFRLTPGKNGSAALEEVVDGAHKTVAKASWAGSLDWWQRVRLETHGRFARGLVDGAVLLRGELAVQSDGRAGLFADGGTDAQFDDLAIHSVSLLHEDLQPANARAWQRVAGAWSPARGGLTAHTASVALALAHAGTWSDLGATVSVKVPAGCEAGLAFRAQGQDACYTMTCSRQAGGPGEWVLRRIEGGKRETLASAPAKAGAEWRQVAVRALGGRIQAWGDGAPLPLVYDFALPAGKIGLYADGKGAPAFARLEVCGPLGQPSASLFETDFAKPTIRGLNQEEYLHVVGHFLTPRGPAWRQDTAKGVLRAQAQGSLWYFEPWHGDTVVRCTLDNRAGSAPAGLLLCGDGSDPDSGYRLAIEKGARPAITLFRQGKPVAAGALKADVDDPGAEVELRRDGAWIVGRAGGETVAFHDPQPLDGTRAGLWSGGSGAAFDDLSFSLAHADGTKFDRVDPDWQPASGKWLLHSGMSCVPWTYWIGADSREQPCLMWNRHKLPADFEMTFRVSEHSIGNEEGQHQHFHYHDVKLILCGTPADPAKGYTVVIGADDGRVSRLLRDGKVVAESRALQIVMGSHCNDPRQIHVRARKEGGRLEITANDEVLFRYDDPNPPAGGQIALGLNGCQANFRDFIACVDKTWEERNATALAW